MLLVGTREGIDYQVEVSDGGTTDGTAIHLAREGTNWCFKCTNTLYHTPVSVASMDV